VQLLVYRLVSGDAGEVSHKKQQRFTEKVPVGFFAAGVCYNNVVLSRNT
jgi:hypothetical protein